MTDFSSNQNNKVVNQIDTQSSALEINVLQSSRTPIKESLHESSFFKTGSVDFGPRRVFKTAVLHPDLYDIEFGLNKESIKFD